MLSKEQILLLTNLTYLPEKEGIKPIQEGQTLGDWLNTFDLDAIDNNAVIDDMGMTTGAEWKGMLEAIKHDPDMQQVQLVTTHQMHDDSGLGYSMVFKDLSTGEGVVAFQGTAGQEWKDNFTGGARTGTPDGVSTAQQMDALEWYQSLDKSEFSSITITGHSKGGNKAKYITLLDDSVDRCVSFDGQGFSDEFMEAYKDNIQRNQGKIENHNVEGDYVNFLLNDVGEKHYYKAQNVEKGFGENHCANTLLNVDSDYKVYMKEGTQDGAIADLDRFLNGYLRSLDPEDKEATLDMIGTMAQGGFNGMGADELIHIMLQGGNPALITNLLAYVLKYKEENPEFISVVCHVLDECKLEEISEVIVRFENLTEQDWFVNLIKDAAWLGEKLEWIYYDKLNEWLSSMGIHLSKEELALLWSMVRDVMEKKDGMVINYNGEDISYPSLSSGGSGFTVISQGIKEAAEAYKASADLIANYENELKGIQTRLRFAMSLFVQGFDTAYSSMERENSSCMNICQTLEDIESEYVQAEVKNENL